MSKPRLKRMKRVIGVWWLCECGKYRGIGKTPAQAYDTWSMYAMPGLDAYADVFERTFDRCVRASALIS